MLVVITVLAGLVPGVLIGPLVEAVSGAVGGPAPYISLAPWHNMTPAPMRSLVAIALGVLALTGFGARAWVGLPMPVRDLFESAVRRMVEASRQLTWAVHAVSLQGTLAVLIAVAFLIGGTQFLTQGHAPGGGSTLPAPDPAFLGWLDLLAATLALVVGHRRRDLALIFISINGLIVSLAFV